MSSNTISLYTALRNQPHLDWVTWDEDETMTVDFNWLVGQIRAGALPDIWYEWTRRSNAVIHEEMGSVVLVWWLAPAQKKRWLLQHVNLPGDVLVTPQEQWAAALGAA